MNSLNLPTAVPGPRAAGKDMAAPPVKTGVPLSRFLRRGRPRRHLGQEGALDMETGAPLGADPVGEQA